MESALTALITGGFMLVVIILNEVAFFFRERQGRKKDFFNHFFSERIKAHEEIMRIMTESGLAGIDPVAETEIVIKKEVESKCDAAHEAATKGLLFVDKHVVDMLFRLISEGNNLRKTTHANSGHPELKKESDLTESVARFNSVYYELLGTLREKSGVKFIEEVFDNIPQERESNIKGKDKKRTKINKDDELDI